jgi:hypothetical protein
MKDLDEDLFKPLSAKVGRKQFSSGGREKTNGLQRCGDYNKAKKAMARRLVDRQRRAKGTLE